MGTRRPLETTGHRDAAFGLWLRDGAVLLVRNARTVGGASVDLWDLPGGAARAGETLDEALGREWHEETGTSARVGALRLVTDGRKQRAAGRPAIYTWRAFVFEVEADGEPEPGAGIAEVRWVPRSEAPAMLSAPYHQALRRHLEGAADGTYASVAWVDPGGEADEVGEADAFRHLLGLTAAAAGGRQDLVRQAVDALVAEGEAAARIEEALLQIVPFAGFPRTIAAFTTVRSVLGDTSPELTRPTPESAREGLSTFGEVYGDTAGRVLRGLQTLHPALAAWTQVFAYGTVLARPTLELRERELLAVSILTALGRLDDPLLGHMRAAIRLGASEDDVAGAVAAVPHSIGEWKRESAKALLARL